MKKLITLTVLFITAIAASAQDEKTDTAKAEKKTYVILELKKIADDDKYGYSPEKPVKVGTGPRSGPQNQHDYLRLLRDAKGKPVKYERKGSCCAYPSKNAIFGMALVDRYEVTYRNEKGRKKKTILYISFYDYEEPMIPKGFKTVGM
jgi:hypothetical protein